MSFRLQTPSFKDKSYETFKAQLLLWKECTDVPPEKQGIFIYLSLPDDDESKIKEKVLDEVTTEELKSKTGLDILLKFFDKHLKKDDLAEEWSKFNEFDDFSLDEAMGVDDYVLKYDSLYNKLVKCGITIPSQILAFRLLKRASLTKDECLLVMSGLDYTKKETLYEQAKLSLKKFKGDNTISFSNVEKDADILVAQRERYVPPMFRGATPRQYPSQSGSYRGRGYRYASSKPTNPLGSDGRPIRCRTCDSIAHLVRDCPHANSFPQANMAVYEDSDSYQDLVCLYSVQESHQFLAEASDSIVLDTGCTATVCGQEWLDVYLASLSEREKSSVNIVPSSKIFKFGAGGRVSSEGMCVIPGFLVGKPVSISTDIVKSDIPLLLSRQAMKKAGIKIDTVSDTAEVLGVDVDLDTTSSGHYSLPLRKNEFEVCAVQLGEDKKASLLKLHRQFSHPPTAKLLSLLSDAGLSEIEESRSILDEIRNSCDICKQYAKTPPRPSVAMPMANHFNEKVAMDLKSWNGRWILHLIDMWSRLTLSVFIDRKKPSVVIDKIMRHWVAHFGVMGTVMHDNGGEFSNDEMRSVCSVLNVKICTTAAESPWQNGLCERVHSVTDSMLVKLSLIIPRFQQKYCYVGLICPEMHCRCGTVFHHINSCLDVTLKFPTS